MTTEEEKLIDNVHADFDAMLLQDQLQFRGAQNRLNIFTPPEPGRPGAWFLFANANRLAAAMAWLEAERERSAAVCWLDTRHCLYDIAKATVAWRDRAVIADIAANTAATVAGRQNVEKVLRFADRVPDGIVVVLMLMCDDGVSWYIRASALAPLTSPVLADNEVQQCMTESRDPTEALRRAAAAGHEHSLDLMQSLGARGGGSVEAADQDTRDLTERIVQRYRSGSCDMCGGKALRRCSACKATQYCGPECQRRDWPTHKHMCPAEQTVLACAIYLMHDSQQQQQ